MRDAEHFCSLEEDKRMEEQSLGNPEDYYCKKLP